MPQAGPEKLLRLQDPSVSHGQSGCGAILGQCLVFSLKFVIAISKSLPISELGNVLVFALLTLDLKRCGTRMK